VEAGFPKRSCSALDVGIQSLQGEAIEFPWPPQWAVKTMNRATADNQSAQAEAEGLEPTKEWVKDLIDEILADEFASADLELAWLDEDDGDPETVLEGRLKVGALTLNEMRDALGLDPYDNAAADRPMVLTATGFVPIEANAGAGGEGADADAVGEGANAENRSSKLALVKASPDDPEHPGWPAGTPGGRGGKFRPKDDEGGETSSNSASTDEDTAKHSTRYAALTDKLTDEARTGETNSSTGVASGDNAPQIAQNTVTPRGFTITHVGKNPLDPAGLNGPILPDEQQKIADALNLILAGDLATLFPHPYKNLPDKVTGAVLPPASAAGYITFDVPGLNTGQGSRGLNRLVIDLGTSTIYYTNTHYSSFYAVNINQP
jgi:hypothetical protein